MIQHAKYVALAVSVVVLFIIARNDLGVMRALTADTSFYTSQLAEVTRLEKEMLQFRADANAYVQEYGGVSRDQMQLSFDLLWSRLNTQRTKFVNSKLDALRNYKRDMEHFSSALKSIDADVSSLQPGDSARLRLIEDVMQRFAPAMTTMNADAYAEMINRAVETSLLQRGVTRSLDRFQWLFVIVSFSGLIILLLQLRRGERLYADLQKRESEIRLLAIIDPLTGLYNRRHFDENMRKVDEGHWPEEVQLLLVDLDGFKQVNDTFGHEAGDHVLRNVAARLRKAVAPDAIFARIGGDEFGILIPGTLDQARDVARTIITGLHQPVIYASKALKVGSSIGISSRPPGPKQSAMMLREADKALYAAKNGGRSHFVVYDGGASPTGDCKSAA